MLMILFRLRYPRWWFDFARELTRFGARVGAYLALLTDRYPSTVEEQAVHLEIEYPDVERDLNRWLPLVKWLLAIPHYIVLLFLWIGAFVAVVIAWFAILFTGRYPRGSSISWSGSAGGPSGHRLRLPAGHRPLPAIQPQRRSLAMTNFPTNSWRKLALAGGVLYLMTFAFSIPAVFLLDPVFTNPDYILGAGPDGQVRLGTLLDLINGLACIGTAVALFPVIRRQSEAASLGFVTSRIFEAAILFIGVANLMAVVTMRETVGQPEPIHLTRRGRAVAGRRSRPDLLVGYRRDAWPQCLLARLPHVPVATRAASDPGGGTHRRPILPRVGYRHPPGRQRAGRPLPAIAVVPIFFWELSLGLWLTFMGFSRTSPPHYSGRGRVRSVAVRRRPLTDCCRDEGWGRMTADAKRTPKLPPRLFLRAAWVVHRGLFRLSGGRFGLSQPRAGRRFGMMRLKTLGRRSGEPRVAIVGYYEDGRTW